MAQAPLTFISQLDDSSKCRGVCKWFSSEKGYGFITLEDGSGDVFVHQSEIRARGYRSLNQGQKIECEISTRKDGRRTAKQVTNIDGGYVDDKPTSNTNNKNNNNKNNNNNNNNNNNSANANNSNNNSKNKSRRNSRVNNNDNNNDYSGYMDNRDYKDYWDNRYGRGASDDRHDRDDRYENENENKSNAKPLTKNDLSYVSALCIVPPETIWPTIEEIRSKHDKAYARWMPHINILFPFVKESQFDEQIDILTKTFSNFEKFEINLENFSYFKKGANKRDNNPKQAVFLEPSGNNCDKSLQDIYKKLVGLYPICKIRNEFHGHLSVGQWTLNEVDQAINEMDKSWKSLKFTCDHISIVSRTNDPNSRMTVKVKIPFGK